MLALKECSMYKQCSLRESTSRGRSEVIRYANASKSATKF
jgi:hypothetical protein